MAHIPPAAGVQTHGRVPPAPEDPDGDAKRVARDPAKRPRLPQVRADRGSRVRELLPCRLCGELRWSRSTARLSRTSSPNREIPSTWSGPHRTGPQLEARQAAPRAEVTREHPQPRYAPGRTARESAVAQPRRAHRTGKPGHLLAGRYVAAASRPRSQSGDRLGPSGSPAIFSVTLLGPLGSGPRAESHWVCIACASVLSAQHTFYKERSGVTPAMDFSPHETPCESET